MRERDIFIEALELGDPYKQAVLLDKACQEDAELRGRVEQLLAEHERPESFILDTPPIGCNGFPSGDGFGSTDSSPITEGPGTIIGPYKLLQQIGEGGMGVVFMAEQMEPIKRTVALKIIKPGMDTRQVIARFEAERQAVAMMDHPNIAKVLDAGTTDSGRPYFVMELVKGVPITKYCDEKHLPLPARLELFVEVCQAVQHAHQKGIIHRDIKPNNVLVAEYDNRPVPKVIDFGVAKATAQRLTERTMFTEFGQVLGTMEYMSPEQSKFNQLDIDTRSDIYSLGVLLYELLAGSTPFEGKRLKEAAHDEMLRIIREEEPPKPSTRLSSIDTLPSVAVNRHTEPASLSKDVQGDLDWIVMKALEKDRNRRYETASGLAADIERHQHDEPVEAGPPSAAYRFRKFARRNKAALATALAVTLFVLLAVIGLVVSNVRIAQETKEKDKALIAARINSDEAKKQEKLANENAAVANAQRSIALKNEQTVKVQELLARRRFYAAQTNLAMQAWEAGKPARMLQLLESQRPRFDEDDLRGFEWYYLWHLCQGSYRFSLPTRNFDNSDALAISPDGKTLATGYGQAVRLWEVSTGRQIVELPGHANLVCGVAFAPDGKTLASSDYSENVKLWDLTTGRERATLKPGQDVAGLQFSGDSQVLALAGKRVQLWDVVENREIAALGESEREFVNVAIAPDGNTVVGTGDREVRIWTREGNDWHEAPNFDAGHCPPVAISPDGKLLAVGFVSLKLYDLPSRQERIAFQGHVGMVFAVAFSADGKLLASGGSDRTVRIWDVATGKQQSCIANPGPVYGVALVPDASVVAAMGTDKIRVWDVAPPTPATVLRRPRPVYAVAYSPDGKTLASHGRGGTKLWDPVENREIATLAAAPLPNMWPEALAFSPDGNTLAASGAVDGTIDLWGVIGRSRTVLSTDTPVRQLVFSPDGKSLAQATGYDAVRTTAPIAAVWDLAAQRRRYVMPVGQGSSSAVAFSPDGKSIALGSQFGVVKLFDAHSGRELTTLQRFELAIDWIYSLAFSPDGRKLATGHQVGVVHIWDVATNQLDATLTGHTDGVRSLAFTDGGRTLATASEDRTIRFWDVATGQERIALRGHNGAVTSLAFGPDGNVLATSSQDGTVRLWRAAVDADARARKREVDPDDAQSPAAHNERGDRLWEYGRIGEAEAAYRQALDRFEKLRAAFPDDPAYPQEMVRSLLSLSLLLRIERDRYPEAESARLRALEVYRELSAHHQAAMYWAYSERRRKMHWINRQQADRTHIQMIELMPEHDARSLNRAAWSLANCSVAKLRDPARAVEYAKQATAIAPTNAIYLSTLGAAYYRAGNWRDAISALEKGMELREGGSSIDWFLMAMAHWRLGEKDVARQWYDKSVKCMDENESTNEELRDFRTEAEELIKDNSTASENERKPD